MEKVLVFGRRKPNNDSIMSSLVYAQLLNDLNDGSRYAPVRIGPLPDETEKMFSAWHIPDLPLLDRIPRPLPGEPAFRVVLTDHNDPLQSVEGIEHAEVVGVIDHHRVSGLRTFAPLEFIALPWGATCTIVAHLFDAYGIVPNELQSACLLSAIMTDTLMLKSPATTVADTSYATLLSERLGVDPVEFGREVFRFRRSEAYTPQRMVTNDVRRFCAGGRKILVGKYVCDDRDLALCRVGELREEMEAMRERAGADVVVQMVVDLSREGSHVLAVGEVAVAERALKSEVPPQGQWLAGVVSRKKQVVPQLLAAAESY